MVESIAEKIAERVSRYTKKLSGDNRKKLYDSQKASMSRQEKAETEELVKVELQVKQLVQGEGILRVPYYIIFGKEIYSKARAHTDSTLINEVEILQTKWIKRGLDWETLDKIKKFYVQAYKINMPFRLDISLLDGHDRLV